MHGLLDVTIEQQYSEAVGFQARRRGFLAVQLGQQAGEFEQHLVAVDAIVHLVDQLELIDVQV